MEQERIINLNDDNSLPTVNIKNVFIIDNSGSMNDETIRKFVVDTFNDQTKTIKETQVKFPEQRNTVTIIYFNERASTTVSDIPVNEVDNLTVEGYHPSGSTALNDTVGDALEQLDFATAKDKSIRVLMTILTDGYENASTRYTDAHIKEKIETAKKKDWVITFLGSNINVEQTVNTYGIAKGNAINMNLGSASSRANTSDLLRNARTMYSCCARQGTTDNTSYFASNDSVTDLSK